jgi:hypothetical protein
VLQVVSVLQVLLSISLMGFTPASQGGTHIVERNLTRLTCAVALAFTATTVALFHLL